MNKKTLVLTLLVVCATCANAQFSHQYDWYWEPGARFGHIIPTSNGDKYLWDESQVHSFDLRFGVQSKGDRAWEQVYRCPRFGAGLRSEWYDAEIIYHDTTDRLGGNISLYGFISGNIFQTRRFGFEYTIGGGLAAWSRHDDPATGTQSNKFISTTLNVYLTLDIGAWAYLSPYFDIYVRGGVAHSSNAALRLPDWGVNNVSGELGIRYHMWMRVEENYSESHRRLYTNPHSIHISDGIGFLESQEDNKRYIGNTFQLGYTYQFCSKFRAGLGFDFMYNAENEACLTHYKNDHPECMHQWNAVQDGTNVASYASMEVLYNRLVIQLAFAKYLYMGSVKDDFEFMPNSYKNFYERLGFKVYVGENRRQFVGLAMKLHVGSIDYAEWTYGVHLASWR